ncbi:MAG: hypothetical protein LBV71_18280 [Prevotella sp.]|jgi:hypothetical protein|nr:hypothetical protein [Prevotella sp.]
MATYTFTAESKSKGQKAKSGDYITIKVPFKFDYYSLSFQHKLYSAERVVPKGFPKLFSNNIIPKNLVKGFLYLFYEMKDGEKPEGDNAWEEYHINPCSIVRDGDGQPILDENNKRVYSLLDDNNGYYYRILKEQSHLDYRRLANREDMDNPKDFIDFSKTDIVWVAYSPIQWSADYLKKARESEKFRSMRFQKLDVAEWLSKEKDYFSGSIKNTIWGMHTKEEKENIKTIDYRQNGESLNFYSYKTCTAFPKTYYFTLKWWKT